MLAAGAIVGISVGLAFLAGVVGLVIHNRYSWRQYRAKHPEGDKKGKDPERGSGGANGGVFTMAGAQQDEDFRRRELEGMGIDPAQQGQDVEMEPVAPPHGEYGYSLDAMVEGHNHPHRAYGEAEGQDQTGYPHDGEHSNGGAMPGVEQQQHDEIRSVPGPSYSPTSFAQRQAVSQSPVAHSPVPRTPVSRSPVSRSPVSRSPVGSHASGSPVARSPAARSPVAGSPARSPVARSPASPSRQPQPYVPPPNDSQEVGRAF